MNTQYKAVHSRSDIVDVFREIEPVGMHGLDHKNALDLSLKIIEEVKSIMDPAAKKSERSYEIARRMREAKKALLQ